MGKRHRASSAVSLALFNTILLCLHCPPRELPLTRLEDRTTLEEGSGWRLAFPLLPLEGL